MAMETDAGIAGAGGFGNDTSAQVGATANESSGAGGGVFGLSVKGIAAIDEETQSIEKSKEVSSSVAGSKGSVDTGIGLIDRKANAALDDPIGTVIGALAGLVPGGMAFGPAGIAASISRGALDKEVSLGSIVSAALRGIVEGDITAAPASQLARNDANLGLAGNAEPTGGDGQEDLQVPKVVTSVSQVPSTPTTVGSPVTQPSVPLASTQPGVRTSNPYAPAVPLRSQLGSIWL